MSGRLKKNLGQADIQRGNTVRAGIALPPEAGRRNINLWAASCVFLLAPIFLYLLILGSETLGAPAKAERLTEFSATLPGQVGVFEVETKNYGYKTGIKTADIIEFRHDISAALERYEQPAILITMARRAVSLDVDGVTIAEVGVRSDVRFYRPMQPHFFDLSGIKPGDGVLKVRAVSRDSIPYIRRVYIGNTEDLERAFMWRQFFGVYSIVIAVAIALMSTVISAALSLDKNLRRVTLSFAGLMLCWVIVNLAYAGPLTTLETNFYRFVYSMASFLMIVASLNFVNEWTFRTPVIRNLLVPVSAAVLTGLLLPIYFLDMDGWVKVLSVADVIAAACVLVMGVQMFFYLARRERPPLLESFIFLLCIWAVMVDVLITTSRSIGYLIWPNTGMSLLYGPTLSILLSLTIVAGFVRLFRESRRALTSVNEKLSTELAAREAEIAVVYRQREAEVREAALVEERKRIMRDMHDGVGGRLLALSLKAKNGRLGPDLLKAELDDSLQELRLIIDSMDTADGELDIALGALRGRIEPLIHDAGMELHWEAGELGPQPDYGPRDVLSIYRMIQESVSNAIRHAGARTLTVKTCLVLARIRIVITDDGAGFADDVTPGKGLSNIKIRAKALGGTAEFLPAAGGGTRVLIDLPGRAAP